MTQTWRDFALGDLLRLKHGYAFKGEFFASDGDFILLTPGNFAPRGGLKLRGEREKFYRGSFPPEFLLTQGDLLVVMTDLKQEAPILGSAAFIPESNRFLHNQRLGKVVERSDEVEERFLYYLLNDDSVRAQVRATASGATVRHTSPDRIYGVRVSVPPVGAQRVIAAVLSAYDSLVENNMRRIEILERMAQAIYREWFVNFRFPGSHGVELAESPLGATPVGWSATTLGEAADIVMGQSPKSESYNVTGNGLPFHQGVGTFGPRFPTTSRYTTVTNRTADAGDVLFSVRAPVGRINIADQRLVIGRGLAAVRSQRGRPWFLLHQLKERFQQEDTMGGGTIFKAVTRQDVHGIPFLSPREEIESLFDERVRPTAQLIRNLWLQNQNLDRTRNLLLHKLVSGQIDVSELNIDTSRLAV